MSTTLPLYNASTAVAVALWRHGPTGRTVAWHQPAADAGFTDLFSATFRFIATATDAQAAAFDVPPIPPAQGLPTADAIFSPIFDGLAPGPGTLSQLPASAADLGKVVEGLVDGERKAYRVAAGDAAQALPGIVRPVNFHPTANAFVFVSA